MACALLFLASILWYCHLNFKTSIGNKERLKEDQLSEQPIVIDYDKLDDESKSLFEDRINRGVASAVNEGMRSFCAKYNINDEIEKKLIWGNDEVGQLLDSHNRKISAISICVIKPHLNKMEPTVRLTNSFELQVPHSNMTIEYNCIESNVDVPIALIRAVQTQHDKMKSTNIVLYYSSKGWKKAG